MNLGHFTRLACKMNRNYNFWKFFKFFCKRKKRQMGQYPSINMTEFRRSPSYPVSRPMPSYPVSRPRCRPPPAHQPRKRVSFAPLPVRPSLLSPEVAEDQLIIRQLSRDLQNASTASALRILHAHVHRLKATAKRNRYRMDLDQIEDQIVVKRRQLL